MKKIIALGFFDGVHIGHRQILEHTVALGQSMGLTPCAFTMKNHPKTLLNGKGPLKLVSFSQRKALIAQCGIKQVFCVAFTKEFAKMQPEAFGRLLKEQYHCAAVVYGENYTFGEKGAGWGEYAQSIWKSLNIEAVCLKTLQQGNQTVSSTRIRALIEQGDVAGAQLLLGRPFSVIGKVIKGAQKGRQIGFPTVNLIAKKGYALPGNGVYLTQIALGDVTHFAITNVGVRPTFYSDSHVFIESHILDYSGDLYGKELQVSFIEKMRDEHKYPSVEDLKIQITRDKAQALSMKRGQ